MADKVRPYWERLSLADMSHNQWEALCDGCGKCCLHKLEDEDSAELLFTTVACTLLDSHSCRCRDYSKRFQRVPDCVDIRQHDLDELRYMPSSCAYRLIHEGKPLAEWHPLVSGVASSVHAAQMSVRDRVVSEDDIDEDDWDLYIVDNL